jgi:hypothetical protein
MKIAAFLLALLLANNALAEPPTIPSAREMYSFGWPDWFANLPHSAKMEISPQGSELSLTYWGDAPTDLEVQRVEVNVLSTMETSQFTIEGRIRYSKVSPGSYLEMWCYFAPEETNGAPIAYVVRTLDTSGPMASLGGDCADFRSFKIPFDFTGAKTHGV